jgi:hypothetical protein
MAFVGGRLTAPFVRLAALSLVLSGCGGSSGGSDGGGGGGGGGTPPTAAITAPVNGVLALLGDTVPITVVANDDGAATVRLWASVDASFATTNDQVQVGGPATDQNGAPQLLNASTTGLGGAYTLFVEVDDGFNPDAVAALGGPFVVVGGTAVPAPPRSAGYGVLGTRTTYTVGEAESGGGDLNGDLDGGDGVPATLDALTGGVTQHTTSMDCTGTDGGGTARLLLKGGTRFFFATREQDEGMLNGDADATDVLTSVVDVAVPNLVTQLFGGLTPIGPVGGTRCPCTLLEAQEGPGGTGQNGDGDTTDTAVAVLEAAGNVLIVFPVASVASPTVRVNGTLAAYAITEAANGGVDLNGSGLGNNTLLALADLASPGNPGTLYPLVGFVPMPGGNPARDVLPGSAFDVSADGRVGYYMNEAAVGPLNGDGDAFDQVPAIWWGTNPIPVQAVPGAGGGVPLNAGGAPRHAIYAGTKFFYTAIEDPAYSPPAGDNGDGTLLNQEILRWTDHAVAAAVTNVLAPALAGFPALTGIALDGGQMARLNDQWLALVVAESANGNLDLTGDGISGPALLLVDTSTTPPTVWNTGLAPTGLGSTPITGTADASGVVVAVTEAENGILNGDGDNTDTLLFYLSFAAPTAPVNLDSTGGPHVHVAGTRVGITAYEGFTQTDFNQDGDNLDFVFRVVSTAGVEQLRGLTCAQVSRPTADDGTLWAFLRYEFAEQRNLNGDADAIDHVMGWWRP